MGKSAILLYGHPGDVRQFFKIGKKTVAQMAINNANKLLTIVNNIDEMILLLPDTDESHTVFDQLDIQEYFGSNNVLNRFQEACKEYNISQIIRIPLVKPLINVQLAATMYYTLLNNNECDIVSVPVDYPSYFAPDVFRSNVFSTLKKTKKLRKLSNPFCELYRNSELNIITLSSDCLPFVNEEARKIALELRKKELFQGGDVVLESDKLLEYERYKFASDFIKGSDKVLDIACGDGFGINIIKQYCKQIVGVDNQLNPKSEETLDEKITIHIMDAMDIDFDNEFDVIISFETIEHLPKPKDFLLKLRKGLKNEGILILSTPIVKNSRYISGPINPYHFKEYEVYELINLVLQSHFRILKIFIQGPSGDIFPFIKKPAAGSTILIARVN